MSDTSQDLVWHKVAEPGELEDGRVKSASAGTRFVAVVHFDGQWAALQNHCPHQGGPLGEGSIERGVEDKCWLRCPWHGWDFDPLTGKSPGAHDDGLETYSIEEREDGVYVGVPPEPPRERTVSDVMAETMVNWGCTTVFGMVGHSNLGFADALRVQEAAGKLHYYGIRHEGAAAFAISGYGKLTGQCAAALTIAGPGATNLLTGLWDAKVDGAPVLALTGQVQEQVIGVHAFQDIDLEAAFDSVAYFSQTVHPNSNHAELMNQAVKSAVVQKDVAHLVFPDNTQTIPAASDAEAGGPDGRLASHRMAPEPDSLNAAIDLIKAAKRPLIVVGYGALDGMADVMDLAEFLNAPVATTFKAKGQIPDAHPLAAGVLGRSGTPIASWFMNECDLMIVFGASFSDHTGLYPYKPTIQVDLDLMRLGKRHPVDVPLRGDVGLTADAFVDMLRLTKRAAEDQRGEIAERWSIWRNEKTRRITENRAKGLSSAALFETLSKLTPDDAILPVDVGNNTYSFGRYFETRGQQRVLMSGYLGSIGFALPAAMGAWAATKDRPEYAGRKVISVSGDGGFGQYAMEITTLSKYRMNICHVLMNNSELGKISKEQRSGEFPVWQTSLVNPSFAGFARSCGVHGALVRSLDELEPALAEAIALDGPALVEITMDAELV